MAVIRTRDEPSEDMAINENDNLKHCRIKPRKHNVIVKSLIRGHRTQKITTPPTRHDDATPVAIASFGAMQQNVLLRIKNSFIKLIF